jgi:hypothetical protein
MNIMAQHVVLKFEDLLWFSSESSAKYQDMTPKCAMVDHFRFFAINYSRIILTFCVHSV